MHRKEWTNLILVILCFVLFPGLLSYAQQLGKVQCKANNSTKSILYTSREPTRTSIHNKQFEKSVFVLMNPLAVIPPLEVSKVARGLLISRLNLKSSITQPDFTCSSIIITLTLGRKSTEKGKKYKHNPIPVIVFGLVGAVVGGYIGSRFDPTTYVPGEFPELFTKGILIGMGVGAIVGGVIGYFLGKEEVKENKTVLSSQK